MKIRQAPSCEVSSEVVSLVVEGELIALLQAAAESEVACAATMGAGDKEPG